MDRWGSGWFDAGLRQGQLDRGKGLGLPGCPVGSGAHRPRPRRLDVLPRAAVRPVLSPITYVEK